MFKRTIGLILLLSLSPMFFLCQKDNATNTSDSRLLGQWWAISYSLNGGPWEDIDSQVFIEFLESLVNFFAEEGTVGRGLEDDMAKGVYITNDGQIIVTWNSDEDVEAANNYLGESGYRESTLLYSFESEDLLIEVTMEGDIYRVRFELD